MREDGTRSPQKTLFSVAVLLLCLLTMVLLCVGALHVLLRQGQEVEVSVETSGEQFTESVTVTLRNVLGMDILIDEQENSCAMLQRRVGDVWENVSEIRFVQEDSAALSAKYGGMYAHLAPGGELLYELDGEQINSLPGGEYRIAIRYISEKAYTDYLNARAREIETSLDLALLLDSSGDPSDASSANPSDTVSDNPSGNASGNTSESPSGTSSDNASTETTSGDPSENTSGDPSGDTSENPSDTTPADTSADTSNGTSTDTSSDASADTSNGTSADTSSGTSADTSSDASTDTSSDASAAPAPSVLPDTELLYAEFVIIPRSPQPAS